MTRQERYLRAVDALRATDVPFGLGGPNLTRAERKARRLKQHAARMLAARLLGTRTNLPKVLTEKLEKGV